MKRFPASGSGAGRGFSGTEKEAAMDIRLQKAVAVTAEYDILVCGGGPAGLAAALAGRRGGLRTMLLEAEGQLGGMGTSGLVSHWLGGRSEDCRHWVVGGIFRELAEAAAAGGIAILPKPEPGRHHSPFGWNPAAGGSLTAGVPFDPFLMAHFLERTLLEAGVDILYMTRVVDASVSDGRLTHVILHNKSGFSALAARLFVDATGDADLAAMSGCVTRLGRDGDGLMTPVTLQVHMDGIDQEALASYIDSHDAPRFLEEIVKLRGRGEWPFAYDRFISVQMLRKGTFMVNTPRITGIDGTDGASVTRGLIQGRREIVELLDIMRRHLPGCADARIRAVAPLLGVRETRRIEGGFMLRVEDLVAGTEFPDTVGFSAYGWDLPDPLRPSWQPLHEKPPARKRAITPIPYRIMLPIPVGNLLCPGRAVSVEREVLGPLRVQAPCMAMGEAAGTACLLAASSPVPAFPDVDAGALQAALRGNGAVVDYDPDWEPKR